MAEGKNIEIRIAATGGDQAAGEIQKVSDAAAATEAASKGSTGFGGMLDGVPERVDTVTAKVEDLKKELGPVAKAAEDVGEAMDDSAKKADKLGENVEKIARTQKAQAVAQLGGQVAQLGSAFKSVASEVEVFDKDLANTLRNTGGNIEAIGGAVGSIAIGFAVGGPIGAGVATLAEGVKRVVLGMAEAAEESVKFAATGSAAFKNLVDKLGDVATAKEAVELKTWLDTLDAEEAAITRQNEALGRNRELIDAKAAAQAKLDAINTKNEIAAVKADPNLTDAEKITKVAEITERAEGKKLEDQVDNQGRDVVRAEEDAKAKAEEAARLAADAEDIKASKDAEAAEMEALKRRQKQRKNAEAAIPAAAAQAGAATQAAGAYIQSPFYREARQKTAAAAQEKLEDLTNKAQRNPAEEARLDALAESKQKLEQELSQSNEKAAKAADDAAKAKLDAESKREILKETLPTVVETYQKEKAGRTNEAQAAAAAAAKRDKEKQEKEQAEADKAKRDREDADAIRAGRDPEEVKIKRIKDDSQSELSKLSPSDTAKRRKIEEESRRKTDDLQESRKEREKAGRRAERDIETDIGGIGQDAAKATRGLGARGVNPEGFNALAAKIAKKGDPKGDKANLESFLAKVSQLVDLIPESKSGSDDAQKLREVERKLEKKIEVLTAAVKNSRNPSTK